MYLIDSLVDMPVATVPCFVIQPFFDGVQPQFRAFVHSGLINATHKGFYWRITLRAGMG